MEDIIIENKNQKDSKYSEIIDECLNLGLKEESKLPEWVLDIEGMSGKCYRHFINNLSSRIKDCRYLEIGAWKGSTSASCGYGNQGISMDIVDNWSQFNPKGNVKEIFEKNISRMKKDSGVEKISIHNEDYKTVNLGEKKFNLYFFDGPHKLKDQYDAINIFLDKMEEEFIFIVDDWNWPMVSMGTDYAIKKNNLLIKKSIEIITTESKQRYAKSSFHNGYAFFILQKQ